ncbi:MAG: hypothetical protein A3B38_01115 [Candidatus Levybacteria bacterium RIFCSPLOWO2_01_FULL_36_13]|nr:MAG: hypothetical protein A2684_02355 [Candidatus Levybacteria bacterium RIFCSPHIGHO2_01_FULL_36_15b]OGH35486.1 MAG: hypothetical protein A3B38_01115 [Candidatus Levybacteria bacterium RIFCSPLOWO2_01_FULL_36_13]
MLKIANIKGFTLIELLIVVGILGILSAAILATLDPFSQFQKGNDSRRKSDLSQIQKAIETYYQDKGSYPGSSGSPNYCLREFASPFTTYCGDSSFTPYMNVVPKDSNSANRYVYYASSDGQSYWIYASLDRGGKDPQACNLGNQCANVPSGASCGGTCNYGVASTNAQP